jgi:hypothetical protein
LGTSKRGMLRVGVLKESPFSIMNGFFFVRAIREYEEVSGKGGGLYNKAVEMWKQGARRVLVSRFE